MTPTSCCREGGYLAFSFIHLRNPLGSSFDPILARWGMPTYLKEKHRTVRAVEQGRGPEGHKVPEPDRGGVRITALRVALRQLEARGTVPAPLLEAWRQRFDSG